MGTTSMRGQTDRALRAIERIGQSKYQAKRAQGWTPGQSVRGVFSFGTRNTVFDRAMTFVHWLGAHYPEVRLYRDVDSDMVAEFLAEKAATCAPGTVRTVTAALRKLDEGLVAMHWVQAPLVPNEWAIDGRDAPRGAYTVQEAEAIRDHVGNRDPELAKAVAFILNSGARIDEAFHLRADKVFPEEKRVELIGKGGRRRRIEVLRGDALAELDLSRRHLFLTEANTRAWKPRLEKGVRESCDTLGIGRRGVHGLRGTAASEFLRIRMDVLGLDERAARRELAQWLGHNPHRTEVTYAYVPRRP